VRSLRDTVSPGPYWPSRAPSFDIGPRVPHSSVVTTRRNCHVRDPCDAGYGAGMSVGQCSAAPSGGVVTPHRLSLSRVVVFHEMPRPGGPTDGGSPKGQDVPLPRGADIEVLLQGTR